MGFFCCVRSRMDFVARNHIDIKQLVSERCCQRTHSESNCQTTQRYINGSFIMHIVVIHVTLKQQFSFNCKSTLHLWTALKQIYLRFYMISVLITVMLFSVFRLNDDFLYVKKSLSGRVSFVLLTQQLCVRSSYELIADNRIYCFKKKF